MSRTSQPECIDLNVQGVYNTYIEVSAGGHKVLVCPCCDGDCEHPSHPGNNPNKTDYPCNTCQGQGHLNVLKENTQNGNAMDRDKGLQHVAAGPLQR